MAKSAEPGMLDLQYASPESEDDMDEDKDGDEDDDEEDEEVEEDEKDVRPAPPSRGPQMVPRQVGMTESRPCTIMSALSRIVAAVECLLLAGAVQAQKSHLEVTYQFSRRLLPCMHLSSLLMPVQVALRQQRPSGAAPPGFEPKEDAESPNAPVPPPGFEVKRVMRSPPGYSRAGNGVTRASPSKV